MQSTGKIDLNQRAPQSLCQVMVTMGISARALRVMMMGSCTLAALPARPPGRFGYWEPLVAPKCGIPKHGRSEDRQRHRA
jgi:hypothetical protein